METLARFLWVGLGGAIGASARYGLGGWLQSRMGASFPWETILINLTGSFLIGLVLGLANLLEDPTHLRLFVAIGVLGGYTTYSTFAYEGLMLLADRRYLAALFYVQFTALGTVFSAWVGLALARMLTGGRV
ncbi:MAG: fluoride efflux transporter CrcB [Fimbriimonadaceae bacterium]